MSTPKKRALVNSRAHRLEYSSWRAMNSRCSDETHVSYGDYGGRGITVCERWASSFLAFLEDMGKRPSRLHTLDRIDSNGNYEPDNCRWATYKQQARNTRRVHRVQIGDEVLTLSECAKRLGLGHSAISQRLRCGWPIERAMTAPRGSRP